jgi:hypothetical protein
MSFFLGPIGGLPWSASHFGTLAASAECAAAVLGRTTGSVESHWVEKAANPPRLFGVEPPKPRIQAVRIVDVSGSNAWAEFAGIFART